MKTSAVAACAALVFAAPALAQDWPMPKMFKSTGQQKGQWQLEMLEGAPKGAVHKMTLCSDNLMKQSADAGKGKPQPQSDCKHRLLKDTADEAVMESTCPERKTTITMKRENPKTILMTMASTTPKGTQNMKMRYTHLGACREGQAAMTLDKDSEQCQKIRAQAAKMDPVKQCAKQTSSRQECEQRMREAVAQMSAMCN